MKLPIRLRPHLDPPAIAIHLQLSFGTVPITLQALANYSHLSTGWGGSNRILTETAQNTTFWYEETTRPVMQMNKLMKPILTASISAFLTMFGSEHADARASGRAT